jgi:hypothetical protein
MSESAPQWRIESGIGRLDCGPAQGCVEVRGQGQFRLTHWQGKRSDSFFVLATDAVQTLEVGELYVRECDLVATFTKKQPDQVTPQIYWRTRLHRSPLAVQIEMILSVQTDLLDSMPETTVQSVGVGSRLFHARGLAGEEEVREITAANLGETIPGGTANEHLFLFRNESLGLSYAEMVHPSDFVSGRVAPEPPRHVISTLFPERLEKGVIRRGRVSGWFLPAENDLAAARVLARQFVNEALPLTA